MSAIIQTDVTVVGAGLVGLAAALAMRQAGYSVALVDSQAPSYAQTDAWDQRIYAISPNNAAWLARLGVWHQLDQTRIGDMQAMQIWGDASTQPLTLAAEDANVDSLGFIVEERALKAALMRVLEGHEIPSYFGVACEALEVNASRATLTLANQQVLQSPLLVAADGANSWVREQLHVAVAQKPYHQTAIVANFATEKSHGNIARQWFTQAANGQSGVLAWLPLSGNQISIVWSTPTTHAQALLSMQADAFTQQVMQAGHAALGELKLISAPAGFPLTLKTANAVVQDSVVLVGDAAHRIHPMAGQGVNLGFRDVMDLLAVINAKHAMQALNDQALLKHYARLRKADLLKMTSLTNGLYHLFESEVKLVKKVRNWGLGATNQTTIKKLLVKSAVAL